MSQPSPKDRFSSLDTLALTRELRAWAGAHVDKVFDHGDAGFSVLLRGAGRKAEVVLAPGRYVAVLPPAKEHAETLSPLARELRRLLTGTVLARVSDPAGERYLEVELKRAADPGPTVLAVELFGQGNVVVAQDGRIAAVARARRWAHRELKMGARYAPPPARDDPWSLSPERIRAELEGSRTDLASTLAARLALGGPLAEEVSARGGWDPSSPASERAAEVAVRLHRVLSELMREVGDAPRGFLVVRGGVSVDANPFPSERWKTVEGCEEVERPTFSEAAEEYFASLVPPTVSPEEKALREQRASLERLAERQQAAADELRAGAARCREDAELLYAHYQEVSDVLARAESSGGSGRSVEIDLAGRKVVVPSGRGVEGAARALYEEAKRLSDKLSGAEEALATTRARLGSAELLATARRAETARPPAKVRWYEKFRWFVTSDGILVLGGRDAPSNDLLVRRHLKDGDLYVHADLQGAASVVVKRRAASAEIPPATVREAAQWAVAFSKAWRAGLASASAFWATPDQVSKSAETGEFVPRGAWVVRGTKHFERDLPLELALGPVRHEGEERWTVAPPSAVRAQGTVRYVLSPGEERDRARLEEALSRELGVSRSVLQRLLPAGGFVARRA